MMVLVIVCDSVGMVEVVVVVVDWWGAILVVAEMDPPEAPFFLF